MLRWQVLSAPFRCALAVSLGVVALGLAGCSDATAPSETRQLDFDFRADPSGWTADFTDFPEGRAADVGFEAGVRSLPDPLEGSSLFHRGNNFSDDLFMYFKHRIEGLEPEARYRARFEVSFASDEGEDCGVGKAPNVVVKAGAAATEPSRVVDEDGIVRLSVDKGSQRNSGENALVLGDIRNGEPGCGEEVPFAEETVSVEETISVSADGDGRLWLLLGTESAFEVAHQLHFTELRVTLERVGG